MTISAKFQEKVAESEIFYTYFLTVYSKPFLLIASISLHLPIQYILAVFSIMFIYFVLGCALEEILNLGWKPKPSIVPDYVPGWPEIICGNRLCSATFISPNGKQILTLSVWFDVKPGYINYYVAPDFDIVEVEQSIQ